jgi:diacylglycerol O-acyltransferase 1
MTTPLALSPNTTFSKATGSYFSLQKDGLLQRGNGKPEQPEPVSEQKKAAVVDPKFVNKYKHIFAIHAATRTSCLSHDAQQTPSFIGFRNLMVLVLGKE